MSKKEDNILREYVYENKITFPDKIKVYIWYGRGDQEYEKIIDVDIDYEHLINYIDGFINWDEEYECILKEKCNKEKLEEIKDLVNEVQKWIEYYLHSSEVQDYYFNKYSEEDLWE